jgi:hypothetical protein
MQSQNGIVLMLAAVLCLCVASAPAQAQQGGTVTNTSIGGAGKYTASGSYTVNAGWTLLGIQAIATDAQGNPKANTTLAFNNGTITPMDITLPAGTYTIIFVLSIEPIRCHSCPALRLTKNQ